MRNSKSSRKTAKQTVSITLNSDLYAQAKALINTSQVAEEALAYEITRLKAERRRLRSARI
jgi:post-segregation antitoxin (ccd killing protein)